jgi:two-component system chemotaxis sensor kinase CheA
LVRIVLETAGYSVESEADGEKAWSRLRAGQRFDAVVTDVEMPILGGLELLARIRASARFRELPVILITALAQDEYKRRALDLGADAYVVKSRFEQQTLLDTLRELIE